MLKQTLKLTAGLMVGIILLAACSDDDEESVSTSIDLQIGNLEFSNGNGTIVDWGSDGTDYNYDFYITDGTFSRINGPSNEASYLIYAELFAPGSAVDGFSTGIFSYEFFASSSDEFYFEIMEVYIDVDGNNLIDDNIDLLLNAVDGTITVSGTEPNFTLTFAVELQNGDALTGSVTTNFEIIPA